MRWTAFMCHWHWHFTEYLFLTKFIHEASHWGGLPLCAIGTGISLTFFCQNSHQWARLLIEVDCLYVPVALTFHCFFLAKFTLMSFPNEVDCLYVPLTLAFDWNLFWQNSDSRGFSLRWTAFMCHWHWHFTVFFSQNSHSWDFTFWWITLMRILIEVDCLYVPLALAFHWKYFLAKFTLMRLLNEVDCLHVPLALVFH